jgi:hypothetical protein
MPCLKLVRYEIRENPARHREGIRIVDGWIMANPSVLARNRLKGKRRKKTLKRREIPDDRTENVAPFDDPCGGLRNDSCLIAASMLGILCPKHDTGLKGKVSAGTE